MNHQFYENFAVRTPRLMEPGHRAAVMLCFIQKEGGWHLLLEERSSRLKHQPGEICLPGGMLDENETPEQAAVREVCEELLITPEQIRLWGPGDLLCTPAAMTLHPFLCEITEYHHSCSPDEVADVFTVPVDWLLENPPQEYITRLSTCPQEDFPYQLVPGGRNYPWRRGKWPVYFYVYQNRVIWGITAKIIYHSLQLVRETGGFPPAAF